MIHFTSAFSHTTDTQTREYEGTLNINVFSSDVAYVFQDMEALISEEMNSLSEQTIDYDVEDNDTSVDSK